MLSHIQYNDTNNNCYGLVGHNAQPLDSSTRLLVREYFVFVIFLLECLGARLREVRVGAKQSERRPPQAAVSAAGGGDREGL